MSCDVHTPGYELPGATPNVPRRIGIDRSPIDVTDEDDRRWLLACVWPDTGRLQRTADALAIAAAQPPDVRRGDIVGDLRSTIDTIDDDGFVCVMTSWAAGYLSERGRLRLADELDEVGARRPVVWLSLEGAGVMVGLFDEPEDPGTFEIAPSVVGVISFRDGSRDARAIALVHPHGKALAWV